MVLLMASSTGCAALPGKGTVSDAALGGNPDAMWSEGQKVVIKGERLVDKGEKQLTEGRQQVRDGQALITEGNERVIQGRLDY